MVNSQELKEKSIAFADFVSQKAYSLIENNTKKWKLYGSFDYVTIEQLYKEFYTNN